MGDKEQSRETEDEKMVDNEQRRKTGTADGRQEQEQRGETGGQRTGGKEQRRATGDRGRETWKRDKNKLIFHSCAPVMTFGPIFTVDLDRAESGKALFIGRKTYMF